MYELNEWDLSRSVILFIVLALHLASLVLLASASRTGAPPALAQQAVELLYLPPEIIPKIRSENARPRRLNGGTAITVAPPVLDSSWLSAPSSSPSNGNGSGIDWPAEARRAVQAYDIRNHRPPQENLVSGRPAEENWWPRHHAGEQFKTENGDWIVWVNESCYRVASSGAYVPAAALPPTICPGQRGAAR
jgi:hypothetical protein